MKLQPDGQFTLPVDDNTAKVRPTGRDIALALSCSVLLMRWEQQQVVLTLVISLCMIVRDILLHRPPQRAFAKGNDLLTSTRA
jgi:hypothetical protein